MSHMWQVAPTGLSGCRTSATPQKSLLNCTVLELLTERPKPPIKSQAVYIKSTQGHTTVKLQNTKDTEVLKTERGKSETIYKMLDG